MNDFGLDDAVKASESTPATHTSRDEFGSGTDGRNKRAMKSGEWLITHTNSNAHQPTPRDGPVSAIREESKSDGGEEEEEMEYNQATLWWFTSTAFPLIAGTFGPIANLFSVCALVQPWRVQFSGEKIRDPNWLIALNSTSLFLSLGANILLLLNFAHRVRYSIAQPLTISLWYISSVFLFVPLGLTTAKFMDYPTHALTQSFYYALIAGVLYVVISTLLLFNLLGAYKFHAYPASFSTLTVPQRTLMLQTISFSFYLALGSGVFSVLEGWSFLDGVYWADYTLLTIGIGSDFPLETTAGRMLLIPFSAFGITLIGLIVGSVRGLVLERAKLKVVRRQLGRQRERWKNHIRRKREQLQKQIHGQEMERKDTISAGLRRKWQDFEMSKAEAQLKPGLADRNGPYERGPWKRAEFELMRHIETRAEKVQRYTALSVSVLTFLFVWIGGSLVFWSCEHNDQSWTYPQSLYFSYTSITTIGYGDFFPKSSAGRPFFVIWSLVAVPTVTVLISTMGDTVVRGIEEATVWLGRHTILPERLLDSKRGPRQKRRIPKLRSRQRVHLNHHPPQHAQHSELERKATSPEHDQAAGRDIGETSIHHGVGADIEKLGQAVEEDETKRRHGDSVAARLAREIRNLAKDIGKKPATKYDWGEWMKWFELLEEDWKVGESEGPGSTSEVMDGERTAVEGEDHTSHPSLGARDGADVRASKVNVALVAGGVNGDTKDQSQEQGIEFKTEWTWTWLGDHGPLFSRENETEWILGKLCLRLEEVLEAELAEKN